MDSKMRRLASPFSICKSERRTDLNHYSIEGLAHLEKSDTPLTHQTKKGIRTNAFFY